MKLFEKQLKKVDKDNLDLETEISKFTQCLEELNKIEKVMKLSLFKS